jgi:plastocyanin
MELRARWRVTAAGVTMVVLGSLLLAAPAAAAPAVATVTADMPSAVPAGRLWAFNDFFPRTVSVPTGTDLQFINQGFHTFTVLPLGTSARSDQRTSGVARDDTDDTTRNPNGTTHSELNNAALGPIPPGCGSPVDPCPFDGSSVISSGTPGGPPAPFVVHVTAAPGTYVFVCRVHAGMRGQLKVLPADQQGPSPADVQAQVDKQVAKDLKGAWQADAKATRDAKVKHKDGTSTWTVTAGTSSADGKVALLEFLPRNVDVRPGDSVVFKPKSPNEPHTVTFPTDFGTEFVPFCEAGAVDIPFGPPAFNCNGGPPDEVEFDGGNGVSNLTSPATISDSGIIAPHRFTTQIGLAKTAVLNTWTASFDGATAGTYTYVCQIHDGMSGTVTVH